MLINIVRFLHYENNVLRTRWLGKRLSLSIFIKGQMSVLLKLLHQKDDLLYLATASKRKE